MSRLGLDDDEYRILTVLTLADGPVCTIRLFDAINPYPLAETGPSRGRKIATWSQWNQRLAAAETRLRRRKLISGSETGWQVTTAGHAALMLRLEAAAAGSDL